MKDDGLYFIALTPPKKLCERVTELKMELHRTYQCSHALKSPPHITLIPPFRLPGRKEISLCQDLDRFASGERGFRIDIDGFGAFRPRVIFLHICRSEPLIALQKSSVSNIKLPGQQRGKAEKPFHPHMTLAFRDLSKKHFNAAWSEFQKREFTASFDVKSIFLLKHSGHLWEIHHQSAFGNAHLSG